MPRLPSFEPLGDGASFVQARGAEEVAASVVGIAVRTGVLDGADVLVVTPTNGGAAGTCALNAKLHDLRRERDRSIEMRGALGERFSDGDPVLFRRNDYRRGLFNGSLGTVIAIVPAERSLLVRFEETEHLLDASDLVDVSVGYALTCHRAQGSQAATVIVAVPRSRIIDPAWIYTAVTRAERKVVLIGDEEALRAALAMPWTSDTRQVGFTWPSSRGEIEGDHDVQTRYADHS
ncbi:ATP-dependent DNA helicase [Lichenihabitans psoromatis]|uniref:ATP-dependent DNA helicase n=1 Tax=Lichenihabitans psoromatis TaxID=2528642 RepID=UPI001FE063B1|nr:ATP-binding domain-containing protein [Lichenihabitans psoromatis]